MLHTDRAQSTAIKTQVPVSVSAFFLAGIHEVSHDELSHNYRNESPQPVPTGTPSPPTHENMEPLHQWCDTTQENRSGWRPRNHARLTPPSTEIILIQTNANTYPRPKPIPPGDGHSKQPGPLLEYGLIAERGSEVSSDFCFIHRIT